MENQGEATILGEAIAELCGFEAQIITGPKPSLWGRAAREIERLRAERDELYRQACLWYDADGNEHTMPSASHAISARKAVARRLWELEAERDRYRDALEFARINLGYLSGLYGSETVMRAVRDHVTAALEGEDA